MTRLIKHRSPNKRPESDFDRCYTHPLYSKKDSTVILQQQHRSLQDRQSRKRWRTLLGGSEQSVGATPENIRRVSWRKEKATEAPKSRKGTKRGLRLRDKEWQTLESVNSRERQGRNERHAGLGNIGARSDVAGKLDGGKSEGGTKAKEGNKTQGKLTGQRVARSESSRPGAAEPESRHKDPGNIRTRDDAAGKLAGRKSDGGTKVKEGNEKRRRITVKGSGAALPFKEAHVPVTPTRKKRKATSRPNAFPAVAPDCSLSP